MLADRYYMRRPAYGSFWSVTNTLLAANVAIFIIQLMFSQVAGSPLNRYFALSVDGMRHGYIWQLLTFQFLHAGWLHLILNCLGLFIFGRELEDTLGRKSFLTLYLSSGVFGGLLQVGAGAIARHFPDVIWAHQFAGATVGASAGVYGLVAAFSMMAPYREITVLAFYVLPINIRMWYILAFSAASALLGLIFPKESMANAAHLGGMMMGVFFIRYAIYWQWPERREAPALMPRKRVKVHPGSSALWGPDETMPREEEMPPAEFFSREVDPILDKISAHGIHSLTEHERKVLESARQKMGKR